MLRICRSSRNISATKGSEGGTLGGPFAAAAHSPDKGPRKLDDAESSDVARLATGQRLSSSRAGSEGSAPTWPKHISPGKKAPSLHVRAGQTMSSARSGESADVPDTFVGAATTGGLEVSSTSACVCVCTAQPRLMSSRPANELTQPVLGVRASDPRMAPGANAATAAGSKRGSPLKGGCCAPAKMRSKQVSRSMIPASRTAVILKVQRWKGHGAHLPCRL